MILKFLYDQYLLCTFLSLILIFYIPIFMIAKNVKEMILYKD